MNRRTQARNAFLALAVESLSLAGCEPTGPLWRAGVTLTPPSSWRAVEPPAGSVPGVAMAAWAGPDGSSLVLYRALPVPGGSPLMIADGLANRLENLPGLRVVVKATEAVAGTTAARVEVIAPGSGAALAPSGIGSPIAPAGVTLTPTREVTVGFVRPAATVYLTWDVRESAYDRIAPDIKATLASIRFTARREVAAYGY